MNKEANFLQGIGELLEGGLSASRRVSSYLQNHAPNALKEGFSGLNKSIGNSIKYTAGVGKNIAEGGWHTTKEMLLPNRFIQHSKAGADDLVKGITDYTHKFKNMGTIDRITGAVSPLVNTGFGVASTYAALNPNKPSHDQMGTFEGLGNRGVSLLNGLAFFSPTLFKEGITHNIGGILAQGLASRLLHKVVGKAGHYIDEGLGTTATPQEMYLSLQKRINSIAQNLQKQYPQATSQQIQQAALAQFKQTNPDYDWSYLS